MRVLFLGTSGINKKDYVNKCAEIAYNKKFVEGKKDPNAESFLKVFDLDEMIKRKIGGAPKYTAYLDNPNRDLQNEIWDETFGEVLDEVGEYSEEPHVFLIIHGVYYRNKNYFSCINRDLLVKFHPTIIVTLIDDAYDVSYRIKQREETLRTKSRCSFSEALEWRTVEILMGDILARNLYIDPQQFMVKVEDIERINRELANVFRKPLPHFIFAVKHNPKVLYRLLFERWRLILYSAYPISSTRTDKDKMAEINIYRKKLNELFTVFDPATIDELLVKEKSNLSSKDIERIRTDGFVAEETEKYLLLKRLPPTPEGSFENPKGDINDFIQLKDLIKKQIVQRDFRLVRQATGLTAYRPYWGGRRFPSGGVDREMIEAISNNKPTFVVHLSKEDGEPELMFRGMENAILTDSLDELLVELRKWQEDYKEKRKEPDTWED